MEDKKVYVAIWWGWLLLFGGGLLFHFVIWVFLAGAQYQEFLLREQVLDLVATHNKDMQQMLQMLAEPKVAEQYPELTSPLLKNRKRPK